MLEQACPSEYQKAHCAILDGLSHEDANSIYCGWLGGCNSPGSHLLLLTANQRKNRNKRALPKQTGREAETRKKQVLKVRTQDLP